MPDISCPRCGGLLPNFVGAGYCNHCGAGLSVPAPHLRQDGTWADRILFVVRCLLLAGLAAIQREYGWDSALLALLAVLVGAIVLGLVLSEAVAALKAARPAISTAATVTLDEGLVGVARRAYNRVLRPLLFGRKSTPK